MNELEFAKHILDVIKVNKKVEEWYLNCMERTSLDETEKRIKNAVENNELTLEDAILLSIFIGLSTNTTGSTPTACVSLSVFLQIEL